MNNQQAARELLPCPFCGERNVSTRADEMHGTKWGFAYCVECGAHAPEVRTQYDMADDAEWRAEALSAWNRRSTTPVAGGANG